MENKKITEAQIKENLEAKLRNYYGISPTEATEEQICKVTMLSVKDLLTAKRSVFRENIKKNNPKRVYYMCMEFLMGRQLRNNLMNLGVADEYRAVLKTYRRNRY